MPGPTLYVALHRNGAVDGYVYKSVIPHANFLISVQLRRSLIGRLFFSGVEIARAKDRGEQDAFRRSDDQDALQACADYIASNGSLIIMPEGSSDLGHRHLPFKKGAARILAQLASDPGISLTVVPLGIHYECAWAWQSDVEVVVGPPIDLKLSAEGTPEQRINWLHERLTRSLDALAVQAESAEKFSELECIAYAATLGSSRSYFSALKKLEYSRRDADHLLSQMEAKVARSHGPFRLWRHQGIPLMPMRQAWAYPLLWVMLAPMVLLCYVLNATPILFAWLAGKYASDGRNTVALWRLLVGFPSLLIWAIVLLGVALWQDAVLLWCAYVVISLIGLKSIRRVHKITISLHNWLIAPGLRKHLLKWRAGLESCMEGDDVSHS